MINNIELLLPHLVYTEKHDFYFVYILIREKDHELNRKIKESDRTVKYYCIESQQRLIDLMPEIINLCEVFKARAYILLQKQNHKLMTELMMIELAERNFKKVYHQQNLYLSLIKSNIINQDRIWLIDVDTKDENILNKIVYDINRIHPDRIKIILPTKNGFHIITKPFHTINFYYTKPIAEIKRKKSPTVLYVPKCIL